MKKIYVYLLAISFFALANIQMISAAGCGTFYIYQTEDPFCKKEHCGIWDTTALTQKQYTKRQCVRADSSTYWEYKVRYTHIDCNC